MSMKILYGEIASQPVVVSLDGSGCVVAYVLIKIDGEYKKFYCLEGVRHEAGTIYLPDTSFSNILVSSVGDKVCVKVSSLKDGDESTKIHTFVNDTRGLGKIDE